MSLIDNAVITFVDDSQLDMMDYYPMVELVFFTIAKALYRKGIITYNTNTMISLYKKLHIEHVAEEQIIPTCIDNNAITLILKPIEAFDYNELQNIYQQIHEFLQAA